MMASNGSKSKAHILVIPFPQSGHMLPLIDLTHQLALCHVTVTVVVTPKNHHYLQPLLHHHSSQNLVKPLVIPFPSHPSIPDGAENMSQLPVHAISHMMDAFSQLYHPLADWLTNNPPPHDSPQAILADMFSIPWTNKLASAFALKSIAFLPTSAHTLSVMWGQDDRGFLEEMIQSTRKSWALLFNSFRDLEPDYVLEDLKTNFMQHPRVLPVGPIIPVDTGADRGGKSSVPIDHLTSWLDSCPTNSVVYVGFGSQMSMTGPQKEAIAAALEKSGVRFIWAMRMSGGDAEGDATTALPGGFEDRTAGRGMVIRGWAPQKVILEHRAVGTYLTHLGWGSVMEGILGGTLLLAWPMHADNHFNVKLLVDELGVAVKVCDGMQAVPDSDKLAAVFAESVKDDSPQRAKLLKIRDAGLRAVTEGGTSAVALDALITQIAN